MLVQIPLTRLRNTLNKLELTAIDNLLPTEQRRKIAMFYRQEEAKRTQYSLEPVYVIPPTVVAQRRPSATEMTWVEFLKCWEKTPDTLKTPPIIQQVTSTTQEENEMTETSSQHSETESEVIIERIREMITNKPEAIREIRQRLWETKKYLKEFQNVSNIRLKRLLYKVKTKATREYKRQNKR
ncbi:unnamed protein product [Macrosiphum euphorbiae]|uniref:Uncharacterized protein n=1 Tax=Macrosiphum euphorbiae TaxID=13131 RepID=A0AAV0VV49_9HEMI|nr:unnamed protein product [Macrosiphum euphorbiae]CAI6346601.1 unnamed protein product [Macrosiphum euphorbiae]